MLADDLEYAQRVLFARQLDIKASGAKPEKNGQEFGVIDISAVRCVLITPWTSVNTDAVSVYNNLKPLIFFDYCSWP